MEKKKTSFYSAMFALVYFTSYLSRKNYDASMAEIILSLGVDKVQASIAVTGAFISYGLGQIINGRLGDKVQPHHLISFGLIMTACCNLCMSCLNNITAMTVVWTINGFAQSMLWPPLVRIMNELLPRNKYVRTVTLVTAAANAASILVYLTVPLWISLSGWRLAFRVPSCFVLVVAAVWMIFMRGQRFAVEKKSAVKTDAPSSRPGMLQLLPILWPIMAIMIVQGVLRDGITTWMPVYIKEVYNMGTSSSILSTAVIPCFGVIGIYAGKALYRKMGDEMTATRLIAGAAVIACLLLYVVFGKVVIITILLMAVVVGLMHSANLILTSFPPTLFRKDGLVSTVSGLLNASVYVGSALSAYGFAAISESIGWHSSVLMWAGIALVSFLISALTVRKWKAFASAQGER